MSSGIRRGRPRFRRSTCGRSAGSRRPTRSRRSGPSITLEADDTFRAFTAALVRGVATDVADLDRLIAQHTQNWRIERLAVIDRLILRVAVWELQHPDAPPAVVLNEAIELARTYGTDDSPRFVNGVLDAVRKALEGPGSKAQGPGDDQ